MINMLVSAALWQLQMNYEPSSWTSSISLVTSRKKKKAMSDIVTANLSHWLSNRCFCLCVSVFALSKQTASMCHSVPMLRVEEWPLPGESLTGDTVRALIDRVSDIYCHSVTPQWHEHTRELHSSSSSFAGSAGVAVPVSLCWRFSL